MSNHTLFYARSRDLAHWEASTGKPSALPITLANAAGESFKLIQTGHSWK